MIFIKKKSEDINKQNDIDKLPNTYLPVLNIFILS